MTLYIFPTPLFLISLSLLLACTSRYKPYLPVFLCDGAFRKGSNLHFEMTEFSNSPRGSATSKMSPVLTLHHFIQRDRLAGTVVMPLSHEIGLDGAACGFVVLHGAVFQDSIDHGCQFCSAITISVTLPIRLLNC